MSYKEALGRLENRRVKSTRPLIPPQILQEDLPLSVSHNICSTQGRLADYCSYRTLNAGHTVLQGRKATEDILKGSDDRLMVVVGCALDSYFSMTMF
jgi:3-deoxy-7-phosphoheptulonate synthase